MKKLLAAVVIVFAMTCIAGSWTTVHAGLMTDELWIATAKPTPPPPPPVPPSGNPDNNGNHYGELKSKHK